MKYVSGIVLMCLWMTSNVWAQMPLLSYSHPSTEFFTVVNPTNEGGFIAVGYTPSSGPGVPSALLSRFDQDGEWIWSKDYVDAESDPGLYPSSVASNVFVGPDGLYWADLGSHFNSDGLRSVIRINKSDLTGNHLWALDLTHPFEAFPSIFASIPEFMLTADGRLWVVFAMQDTGLPLAAMGTNYYLMEINTDGAFNGLYFLDNPESLSESTTKVLVSAGDAPAVMITHQDTRVQFQTLHEDLSVQNRSWVTLETGQSYTPAITDACRCANGDVLVTGNYIQEDNMKGFVVRFSQTGEFEWARYTNADCVLSGVEEANNGNALISGYTTTEMALADNGFIALINPEGEVQSSRIFQEEQSFIRTYLSSDAWVGDKLVVLQSQQDWSGFTALQGGIFTFDEDAGALCPSTDMALQLIPFVNPELGTMTNQFFIPVDPGGLVDASGASYEVNDYPLMLEEECTLPDFVQEQSLELRLYPNPTSSFLVIQSNRTIRSVSVEDTQGRSVLNAPELASATIRISTETLPAGTFIARCLLNDGRIVSLPFIQE